MITGKNEYDPGIAEDVVKPLRNLVDN